MDARARKTKSSLLSLEHLCSTRAGPLAAPLMDTALRPSTSIGITGAP